MRDTRFLPKPPSLRLQDVADLVGASILRGDPNTWIDGAAPLDSAGPGDLSFLDNPKYVSHLAGTRAAACLCQKRYVDRVPEHVAVLESAEPYRAYGLYLAKAFPAALRPQGLFEGGGAFGTVHSQAKLEDHVRVEPGAVVGAHAEIGRGTLISAGAVVGEGVAIGRDCSISSIPALVSGRTASAFRLRQAVT
jgi:UDP-3-O-[3-hydroxymyristoyl] glucosamine N-acyltransferase